MENYSHPDLCKIIDIEENNKCFDCGIENPKWTSLNNAVFLCLKCANIHRRYESNISFIRSLQIDAWNENQIALLKKGGNARFRAFLAEYHVPEKASMKMKYCIKASQYYRKLLKSEAGNISENCRNLIKPDILSGLEMIDENIESSCQIYPEVNNECFTEDDYLEQMEIFFEEARETIKEVSLEAVEKVKEMEIGDRLKETGKKSIDYACISWNFLAEKGIEFFNSEFLENVTQQFETGFMNVATKTIDLLSSFEEHSQERADNDVPANIPIDDMTKGYIDNEKEDLDNHDIGIP